jgi:hypothetical protein
MMTKRLPADELGLGPTVQHTSIAYQHELNTNFLTDFLLPPFIIQGDQKVSVHLMITVQKTRKNILNSFNHLP